MGNTASRRNRNAASGAPVTPAEGNISNKVALGAGCYWGTEKYIRKDFQKIFPNSIKSATVGFMSPEAQPRFRKPSYKDVCTGRTGHVEVLLVELHDPTAHFEELMRFFFMFHDPTQKNRQGNDRGTQYASWIFCGDDTQTEIATRVKEQLQNFVSGGKIRAYENNTVTTAIGPLREFTKAEEYHQNYLDKHPNGYCVSFHRNRRF
eukprot:scaffold15199_cov170-Amphora_coffeaeformis.AAC.3